MTLKDEFPRLVGAQHATRAKWRNSSRKNEETPSSNNKRDKSTHGHHQMVNIEIRLITFFAAEDGVALQSQQKQYREQTVAQIMNSLLQNSEIN